MVNAPGNQLPHLLWDLKVAFINRKTSEAFSGPVSEDQIYLRNISGSSEWPNIYFLQVIPSQIIINSSSQSFYDDQIDNKRRGSFVMGMSYTSAITCCRITLN